MKRGTASCLCFIVFKENFSSFFMPEPKFFEEGMLVWCKLRRYPYWPAVVRAAPASSHPADKEQIPPSAVTFALPESVKHLPVEAFQDSEK